MLNFGFRTHKVFVAARGEFDTHGAYVYAEVTNNTGGDLIFYPNFYDTNGGYGTDAENIPASEGITIKTLATRNIPMQLYNFKASGTLTVVAYRR